MKTIRTLLLITCLTPGAAFAHDVLMPDGSYWKHHADETSAQASVVSSPAESARAACDSATWPYIPAECLTREAKPQQAMISDPA